MSTTGLQLFDYFRSSAAYRVRIALNLKGIDAEQRCVHLLNNGGEHKSEAYQSINPQGLVPALRLPGGDVLTQSLAILEYLEETHPLPAILPADPIERATVRAMALSVACDIHPLNNLRVLDYLKSQLGHGQEQVGAWYSHWITTGFTALEQMIADTPFCHGSEPGIADICLVPQVFNARRFDVDLTPFPKIASVDARCARLAAFADAHPDRQPDAP